MQLSVAPTLLISVCTKFIVSTRIIGFCANFPAAQHALTSPKELADASHGATVAVNRAIFRHAALGVEGVSVQSFYFSDSLRYKK
jgi:hypothetical protein